MYKETLMKNKIRNNVTIECEKKIIQNRQKRD